ncbi:plakophilin-3a isoform X2 [Echeneis naucrates]|uniref:Plakophilin 3 n=2 Tax=Echeneis naucrates TaxID=173247 RepID=A0A665UPY9_ECHNA|nr:plakophilin-3 isoform X2 [Echeneis naucrates]
MVMPNSSVTTYGLPSDFQLESSGSLSDSASKARRVQQQVQMRLAQKSTLPRQSGSASQYATSEYGGSSSVKYQTYQPSFSSKSSYMYTGSRTMGPHISQRSGFSSHSAAPDLVHLNKMSVGGGGGGGGVFYRDMSISGYQGGGQQRIDPDFLSMASMRMQAQNANGWMADGSDAGSMVSDRDATISRQYTQSTMNGYSGQMRQGGGTMSFPQSMRRSLSGTLSRAGGMAMGEMEINQQHSFKGPAHRTISRITNRNNRMSMGSISGGSFVRGGDTVDRGFITSGLSSASQGQMSLQRQGTLSRAMSIKSMHSVGKGVDIFNGSNEFGASMGNISLSGLQSLDMATAVQHLREPDHDMQVLGAAYIQHECYSDSDAKNEVRRLKGIGELVKLFNSENQEVQRYATGATRNLIYENMDNKVALIEAGGIPQLVEALREEDDELRKNITGILWNLSSKDNLKEKLARETLPELTNKILIPLSGGEEAADITLSPSEADIFYNTTGCLRNLSSVNDKTRRQMRETQGLVQSLVRYITSSLDNNRTEDKGLENAVCVLRNLSFQLYNEMPPSAQMRLEGPTRNQDSERGEAIGCFTPQSRKAKTRKSYSLRTFTEVSQEPKGVEWLWHPKIVGLYNRVLHECEINCTTREAAAGALQNITAGDKRWPSVLSQVALEQERMLPVLLDSLRTNNDAELRTLTGFLRNLSRHANNKGDMATKVVNNLVSKLPEDGNQKVPSSDVVVNICGVLNNLVTGSQVAARDITYFNGLEKLVAIKNSDISSSEKNKASKAAATVLSNMFLYKKLHKQYKEKGFTRESFLDGTI